MALFDQFHQDELHRVLGKPRATAFINWGEEYLSRLPELLKMSKKVLAVETSFMEREKMLVLELVATCERLTSLCRDLPRGCGGDEAARPLAELKARGERWLQSSDVGLSERRGRKDFARRRPAGVLVVQRLSKLGVPLTKSADGQCAKVLAIVYDAMHLPAPTDLYRDTERLLRETANGRASVLQKSLKK